MRQIGTLNLIQRMRRNLPVEISLLNISGIMDTISMQRRNLNTKTKLHPFLPIKTIPTF